MTISRADIATYLSEQYSSLGAAVGQSATATVGFKPDIDDALRKLGTVESNLATATVADSLREDVFALAAYYAARRIWRQLGSRVNTTTGVTSYNFTDMRKSAKEMMDNAADACALLGYSVDGRVLRTALFRVY